MMLTTVHLGTSTAAAARVTAPSTALIDRLFHSPTYAHRNSNLWRSPRASPNHRALFSSTFEAMTKLRPSPIELPGDEEQLVEECDESDEDVAISYAEPTPNAKRKSIKSPFPNRLLESEDEEEDDEPPTFKYLSTPAFDIYVDTPLRARYAEEEVYSSDEESEPDDAASESPLLTPGRVALGRIRDENRLWTEWRLGPLEA